jgi:phosphoglycolate phosphatase-like HAD superfamily hydrolase
MTRPGLLALDFDGVLCDSVREALRTAWDVCRELGVARDAAIPPAIGEAFVRLRPVAEFGWEFPVLAIALVDGVPEAELAQGFQASLRDRVLERHRLNRKELAQRVDSVRDRAIRSSIDAWLADQGLYPGVAERLRKVLADDIPTYVITTKEGRFAHRLLEVGGVSFPPDRVWGKEQVRPKPELLRKVMERHNVPAGRVWFVEDRLKTLRAVEPEADLDAVGLFFATWGYTLPVERLEVLADPRIVPLTLEQFCSDFAAWLGADDPHRRSSAAHG